jgi:hypothetical protein
VTQSSWIVQLRERLSAPPPVGIATEGTRQAALVPLFVEGGELWLLLRRTEDELVPGAATLPLSPILPGEEPWTAAERCAPEVGADPAALLRLGLLDSVPEPSGDVLIPCVAAVPAPPPGNGGPLPAASLVRLPLRAARAPSLLEERRVVLRGVETWVTVGHFGPVKLAAGEVEMVELLLERVFG